METYNHYLNTYNEYGQNLQGDLPLALFMIKLLSVEKNPSVFDCYVTDLPMRFEELGNIFFWF